MTAPGPVIKARDLRANKSVKKAIVNAHVVKKSNGFRWYWLAWLIFTVVSFLVPELIVLFGGRVDLTLSDTVEAVSKRYKLKWVVTVVLGLLAAGAVVLGVHFYG